MEAIHLQAREGGRYGLPCPMLVAGQGRCSIYGQRPPLCMSYHCYVPDRLWREAFLALQSTLGLLQDAVARVLVERAGFSLRTMAQAWEGRSEEDIWQENRQDLSFYRVLWQDWYGREREFFLWCFAQIQQYHAEIYEEACASQRRFLWTRLEAKGALSAEREAILLREAEAGSNAKAALKPLEPPQALRDALFRDPIEPSQIDYTLYEMGCFVAWYLDALTTPSLARWWRGRWQKEQAF